ncbi:MAG: GNAT family N-acetyltransferase [Pseudomonadota bacterium]|jgi:GNAT superfamily N-acetyltransferase|nr:GNAT family N-acetyltransferase [Pseudomonadota bacterium]
MTNFRNLVIAPLNAAHDRVGFRCNVEALDQYIHKQAGQDIRRRISRIFVAALPDNPKEVMGYYSLSTLSIELRQLPEKLARKLPKHPVPVALIGRLAVSKNAQGCGIGKMLLVDAIKRTLSVSDQIAIYAIVVDAINDNAKGFYEQFGFARLSDDSPRLFLPLKSFEDNPVPINPIPSAY